MSGRRRHNRFEIAEPWDGSMLLLREVTLIAGGARSLTLISSTPAVAGEVMRLEVPGEAAAATLRVQVTGSRPVPYGGLVRYAVHCDVLDGAGQVDAGFHDPAAPLTEVREAASFVGVLTRDVPVRMRNVSGSGCLLEIATAVEPGMVAPLRMHIGDRDYGDDVRVIRCRRVEGAGSTHRIGVEFAWTTQPGEASLRRIARKLAAQVPTGAGVASIHGDVS